MQVNNIRNTIKKNKIKYNIKKLAIYTSDTYGGSALGRLEASLIFEGLATGCVGSSAYLSIHNMCCWMIDTFGNEEQRTKYLPLMSSLEYFSSYSKFNAFKL